MNDSELTDLQFALAAVWSGADRLDAEAVADQLEDLGWIGLRPRVMRGEVPLPFPEASTSRLPTEAAS